MSRLDWHTGVHDDFWTPDEVGLYGVDVSTVEFELYLPAHERQGDKRVALLAQGRPVGEAALKRAEPTQFSVAFDRAYTGFLSLRFDEIEQIRGDNRRLGAVCVRYRFDGGEWLTAPVAPEGAFAPAPPPPPPPAPSMAAPPSSAVRNGLLSRQPLVSVIVTNLNGRAHLDALFRSLARQTYRNFEIVFVDDNSADGSVEFVRALGVADIVVSPGGAGFTGANNLGLDRARGEIIALLNNDTRVDAFWLEALVARLRSQPDIGAATSKIRFFSKFSLVELTLAEPFDWLMAPTLAQGAYRKFFPRVGRLEPGDVVTSWKCDDGLHRAAVHLPSPEEGAGALQLHVRTQGAPAFKLSVNDMKTGYEPSMSADGVAVLDVAARAMESRRRYDVHLINNAGSVETPQQMPADRGMAEIDDGQYDDACEVPYFCGCSVAIRRDALNGADLFIDEMVAYYEDSLLSLRLRAEGYRIVYEPRSLVYHKHSATTVENSPFWRRQTTQNAIVFSYQREPEAGERMLGEKMMELNHLRHWYAQSAEATDADRAFCAEIPAIMERAQRLSRGAPALMAKRRRLRIGVFNPYWDTLGGGEAHALNFAVALAELGLVELIATRDFDLAETLDYFHVRDFGAVKRLVSEMTTEITAQYDIFVNSCFESSLASAATRSYYIVSFPHAPRDAAFLSTYKFLANSNYTLSWMRRRWGAEIDAQILYPCVSDRYALTAEEAGLKERLIISVGRFVATGHIKSQLEIAEAFRAFSTGYDGPRWKLALIGSVNDEGYLQEVRRACEGIDVEIVSNASFEQVVNYYKRAAVYAHASGIGRNPDEEPELFEHFGIAVAQGIAAGCTPVVYDTGGPAEILRSLGVGYTFSTVDDLAAQMTQIARQGDAGLMQPDYFQRIADKGRGFGWQAFAETSRRITEIGLGARAAE